MGKEQQKTAEYRAIHPLGVVPALITPSYTMFESVAIVLQLCDEHPEAQLAPAVGSPQRAAYYQWSVFACAELDPAIMMYFDNALRPVDFGGARDDALAARGREGFRARADILSDHLRDRDYLLGPQFSGADILVGHSCFMATHTELIGDHPVLEAWHARLTERPAYRRAYATPEQEGPRK
nr:glutathione S-transferase family protein [Roseovarius sp. Pro17]